MKRLMAFILTSLLLPVAAYAQATVPEPVLPAHAVKLQLNSGDTS